MKKNIKEKKKNDNELLDKLLNHIINKVIKTYKEYKLEYINNAKKVISRRFIEEAVLFPCEIVWWDCITFLNEKGFILNCENDHLINPYSLIGKEKVFRIIKVTHFSKNDFDVELSIILFNSNSHCIRVNEEEDKMNQLLCDVSIWASISNKSNQPFLIRFPFCWSNYNTDQKSLVFKMVNEVLLSIIDKKFF